MLLPIQDLLPSSTTFGWNAPTFTTRTDSISWPPKPRARLTIPPDQWLSARYLASFTWPFPPKRVEKRDDGITYYNTARAVDEPLVATVSTDGKRASFTRTTGNVWSNPELTCQHVDPKIPLAAGASAAVETTILVFRGSLG